MKEMLERLEHKKIVFSSLHTIDPKPLGLRKKMTLFCGVDLKSYYHLIICSEQQSRFLVQQGLFLDELATRAAGHLDHNFKYKHFLLNAPLCSKANLLLSQNGWMVYNDFM